MPPLPASSAASGNVHRSSLLRLVTSFCSTLSEHQRVLSIDFEHRHRPRQFLRLAWQAQGCCSHLLHQRRIVLCHLVNLDDRFAHLSHADALPVARRADLAHEVCHSPDTGDSLIHRLTRLINQLRTLVQGVTLSTISVLISFAAPARRPAKLRTSNATTAKPRPCCSNSKAWRRWTLRGNCRHMLTGPVKEDALTRRLVNAPQP